MEIQNSIGFKNNPAYRLVVYTVIATAVAFGVKQIVNVAKCGGLEEITITAEEPVIVYEHQSDKYDAGVQHQTSLSE